MLARLIVTFFGIDVLIAKSTYGIVVYAIFTSHIATFSIMCRKTAVKNPIKDDVMIILILSDVVIRVFLRVN